MSPVPSNHPPDAVSDANPFEADDPECKYESLGQPVLADVSNYDSNLSGEIIAEIDTLEGTPARSGSDSHTVLDDSRRLIVPVATILIAILAVGVVTWLLTASSDTSTRTSMASEPSSYPITRANADITGLGTGPRVSSLAPDFALADVYTGKMVKLSSLRGRPVWINFWASWCPPCREELPQMQKEYAKYEKAGLALVGVDMREDPQTVRQFTIANSYNWNFVVDSEGQVTDEYFVFSVPTHIFVDKDGLIKSMQIGSMSSDVMEEHLSGILNP